MLISVIIPVYNVKPYITKCLDSVIQQTYQDLQIILVNDGSTDGSGEICEDYAKRDDRIQVVHKKNGGLMSAWMAGIDAATGGYVTFIDSDDWVETDMMEKFAARVQQTPVDMVVSHHIEEYEDRSVSMKEKCAPKIYGERAIKWGIFPKLLNDGSYFGRRIRFSRCSKLIRTDIIKRNLHYCDETISYGEDVNILFPVLLDCRSICVEDAYFYHYRQNPASIMHTYKKNMEHQVFALTHVLKTVNREKNRYDFTRQIHGNFLCMLMALIRNEFGSEANSKDIVENVMTICAKPEVRVALTDHSLKDLSEWDKLLLRGISLNKRSFYYLLLNGYRMKNSTSRFLIFSKKAAPAK